MMLLNKFMPVYQFNETHRMVIQASPERIFKSLYELTPTDIWLFQVLFGIRLLPAHLIGQGETLFADTQPVLTQMLKAGFIVLAKETNREIVLGAIGQFWKPLGSESPKIANVSEFLAFDHPDYAKAMMNFYVEQPSEESDVKVSTETRIYVPYPTTRKKFAAYWRLIYPGSALIRIMWLEALKRRAEAKSTMLSEAKV